MLYSASSGGRRSEDRQASGKSTFAASFRRPASRLQALLRPAVEARQELAERLPRTFRFFAVLWTCFVAVFRWPAWVRSDACFFDALQDTHGTRRCLVCLYVQLQGMHGSCLAAVCHPVMCAASTENTVDWTTYARNAGRPVKCAARQAARLSTSHLDL